MDDGRPAALTRVPPSNLRAEESVLGAMLLSRDAIAEVVEVLEPDHFYKPAHGHLYDAVLSLYSAGEPVDAVTVADELERAGLLEDVGGPAVLLDFQATTPAISNAAHYARIVEEHALLRRMIAVSNEIAEVAYSIPDDVAKAVDDAEARIFDVAQRRVTDTTAPLRDLLPANLDRIEMLYDRGESITGLSTGYLDLDEKLAGLQPSSLYVVGARPAMGKALALGTPIATPGGWSTMGDLGVGDQVFDETGRPCTVVYKSPIFTDHDCYEVVFDDGSVIVADGDHQWFTWDHRAWTAELVHDARHRRAPTSPSFAPNRSHERSRPRRRTTRELAATLRTGRDRRPNHRIPVASAIDCPQAALPLDPYLLGVWLAGGHAGGAMLTTSDDEIVAAFLHGGWLLEPRRRSSRATTYSIRAAGDRPGPGEAPPVSAPGLEFSERLRAAGVGPGRRRVPMPYLRASIKQRMALLQGLMDIDGSVVAGGETCELALSNRFLLEDARDLALSLGFKAGPVVPRSAGDGESPWRFRFTPPELVFRLPRKCAAQRVADRPDRRSRWRSVVEVRPVPAVPTQCITVDSASHLYLAGREMVPTHNTAFALGLAANSAMKDRKPVLIFTLEMSQLELSQRLLCSEALVDAGRVKTGRLEEGEWNRISHAVGRLAEAPIFIDDNPHTSVMDIRAKARRLKSREGDLGMVVVDYIQLMTGRSSAENRQVEVSEISRNLKILARELDSPVVALAQLNRSLEQRTDKRPMLSDLRESGCLTADTRILRADNGQEVTIAELVLTREQPLVWSVDDRQRFAAARLTKAFPSGVKPVFRVRLASGRSVDASANHPFCAIEGWRRLDELDPGTLVAVPVAPDEPSGPIITATTATNGERRGPRSPMPVLAPDRQSHLATIEPSTTAERIRLGTATPDLSWDEVVSIEPLGEQPTFDATVDGTHNFVANGIVVHNSLEQDADVVLFLYRDEVYDDASPDKGVAEVIIAKHRNGPTGKARLAFRGQYTRFDNMARSLPGAGPSQHGGGGPGAVDF